MISLQDSRRENQYSFLMDDWSYKNWYFVWVEGVPDSKQEKPENRLLYNKVFALHF